MKRFSVERLSLDEANAFVASHDRTGETMTSAVLQRLHQEHLVRRAKLFAPASVSPEYVPAEDVAAPKQDAPPPSTEEIARRIAELMDQRLAAAARLDVPTIQRVVAWHFNIRRGAMLSSSRRANIVWPRQVAMYLCRKMLPHLSLPQLGGRFGGRDHSTVLHAVRKIERLIEADATLAAEIEALRQTLLPPEPAIEPAGSVTSEGTP